jgi:hypothetical protein
MGSREWTPELSLRRRRGRVQDRGWGPGLRLRLRAKVTVGGIGSADAQEYGFRCVVKVV